MLVMESFGSDHLPKLHLFSDFNALCDMELSKFVQFVPSSSKMAIMAEFLAAK